MASCFIKKIFEDKIDDQVHGQFVRFGKGVFSGRAAIKLQKVSKVKLSGGFEYANDFASVAAELDNIKFSGLILSKQPLGLENEGKKKGMYTYEVADLDSKKIKEIENKAYFLLLDANSPGIILKMKKKLPKPGKSEGKIDDRFCVLEADLKLWPKIKEVFLWDIPDCKKAIVTHQYTITNIIPPKNETDFEKIRLNAKRETKIIRKIEFDGKMHNSEKNAEI